MNRVGISAPTDRAVDRALHEAARVSGHRLSIAHGALVGLEALAQRGAGWDAVTVRFRTHPRHDEPRPGPIDAPTLLFDVAIAEAADGTVVVTVKRAPLAGAPGVEMSDALVHSIVTATGGGPGLRFV